MKLKARKESAISRRLLSGKKSSDRLDDVPSRAPSETQFNRRRRMMAFIDGKLHIAPAGSEKFHRQWFSDEGWIRYDDNKAYEKAVRGFVDHRGLFLYRGSDFSPMGVMTQLSRVMVESLVAEMDLPLDTKVYLGLTPCHDELWKGQALYGTLEDLLDIADEESAS